MDEHENKVAEDAPTSITDLKEEPLQEEPVTDPTAASSTDIPRSDSQAALAHESRAASIIQQAWRNKKSNEVLNSDLQSSNNDQGPVTIATKSQESIIESDTISSIESSIPEHEEQFQKISQPQQQHVNSEPVTRGPQQHQDFPDISTWVRKRYMGGYKSKKDGRVFFNAFSQTPTAQEIKDLEKSGCHVSQVYDYAIRPKPYFSAADHEKMLNYKVTIIQCFIRKCFAIRLVRKLRRERDARLKAMAAKEKRRKALEDKKRKKEIESRLHPKTTKDFEILYNGLEHWRIQETETINNAGYSEPARLAALADLMDQEAALIQKIDRLKIAANEENREKGIVKLLENMSSPKKWPVLDGTEAVLVDTPNTIRARELRDLYHALNVAMLTVDERLQILLHVKYTVKEFDCILTREIVELINREGDLVSRGRDAKSLEGLRKRISNLFLQFVQTPEFNPEAAVYQKFPDAGQSWKRDQAVYYCRGCTKYLPSTEFYLSTTMKHLGRCKPCTIKENTATHRKDDSCYGDLLKSMRSQESEKRKIFGSQEDANYNAIALLQESDMRHLIDVIWNRQSCISAAKNMDDLVMTRWDPKMEVSPWNCILLTKSEAEKHDIQSSPVDLYTDDFIRKIKQKHLAAKRHFSQLPAMERYLKRHYLEDHDGRLIMRPVDH
ncbi:UNVERIFIED_CONTAM: hypothetical protein HDU68_008420 [Siphonaria sp. JEL0065]|nr:hypothetical protein HDU68_008420 [Siphonaria sp. JEL0065]